MRLEDYTDDVICRSMGLDAFVPAACDPSAASETVRFLFRPSFDPELVITFSRTSHGTKVRTIALRSQLWHEALPCRMAEVSEQVALPPKSLDSLFKAFGADRAAWLAANQNMRCIDGMGISAVRRSGAQVESFLGHTGGPEMGNNSAAQAVKVAWEAATKAPVKHALARVGKYFNQTYPKVDTLPEPSITRLLILGTEEGRKDYFEILRSEER